MTGDGNRDLTARLAELEATVRGLTQELVSAEERIRQLEAELEGDGEPEPEPAADPSPAEPESDTDVSDGEAATDKEAEFEDIIVA
ncbi:MAG: hypothetical protein ABEH59_13240 [Halobacteriales archaeon]